MKLHLVLDSGDGAPEGARPGPLTVDLLKTLLPFDDDEFFLCGPPGFMQTLYDGLRDLGVRDARIQAEAFGPVPPTPPARQAAVVFARSGEAAEWTPARGTLLEIAEGKGLRSPFACRAGHCGSCATRLTAGRVTYAEPTAWRPTEGEVLLCCAVPAAGGDGPVELDLRRRAAECGHGNDLEPDPLERRLRAARGGTTCP